eukprot:5156490-Alexandrium_andersonii.AAC.1
MMTDQRRRQRLILPMSDAQGQVLRRDIYMPLDADPETPNGVGVVFAGLRRHPDTRDGPGYCEVDSGEFCTRLSLILGIAPKIVVSTLCVATDEVLLPHERGDNNHGAMPAAGLVVVLNDTAARVAIEAARGGLLSKFQHQDRRIEARCLPQDEQRRLINGCGALKAALDESQNIRQL